MLIVQIIRNFQFVKNRTYIICSKWISNYRR